MKRGITWMALTCLIVMSMILASCSTSTSISIPATTSTTAPTIAKTTTSTTIQATISSAKPTTTSAGSAGNWWDKLGTPQYGGTLTIFSPNNINGFDDYNNPGATSYTQAWEDTLVADDWTLNPSTFSYQLNFRPSTYEVGNLGKSWEFTDPLTYVVYLRQGIHWQNISPANGREFVADDVVFHWDRRMGWGHGYTTPSPYYGSSTVWQSMKSVTAPDKYTVIFKFQGVSEESICETVQGGSNDEDLESPDAAKLWGDLNDWHHAIGTGPFILKDYVSGSSMTLIKNPNYWAYDERHPENQLPYMDGLKILIIPDPATSLAAFRTGKIDAIDNISITNAQLVAKTNPEIKQITFPAPVYTIDPKCDVKPFTDIRVREALQMALDLPTIAATYYQGSCPATPSTMTSMYMTGWTYPYDQWPQSLKDEYAYNPTKAKQLLADAGYPTGFKTDVVAPADNDLDLLQIVKSYYSAIGVDMTIQVMEFINFNTLVRAKKNDQLAYCNNYLGFTFPPLMGFRRWQTGFTANWCDVSDPVWDAMYIKALAAPSVADTKDLVIQGNKYMAAQHWVISVCNPNVFALYQPWLKGYNAQSFSISESGGSSGALWIGFYAARFWIDTNLKASMQH